jgi:hypothetical protein
MVLENGTRRDCRPNLNRALDRSCGIAGENGFLDLAERVGHFRLALTTLAASVPCHVEEERLRFVARLLDGEQMTALCAEFGISRPK